MGDILSLVDNEPGRSRSGLLKQLFELDRKPPEAPATLECFATLMVGDELTDGAPTTGRSSAHPLPPLASNSSAPSKAQNAPRIPHLLITRVGACRRAVVRTLLEPIQTRSRTPPA